MKFDLKSDISFFVSFVPSFEAYSILIIPVARSLVYVLSLLLVTNWSCIVFTQEKLLIGFRTAHYILNSKLVDTVRSDCIMKVQIYVEFKHSETLHNFKLGKFVSESSGTCRSG